MATAGKVRNNNNSVYLLLCILFFSATLYHHYLHPNNSFSISSLTTTALTPGHLHYQFLLPSSIDVVLFNSSITFSPETSPPLASVSVLLPAWEVLVILSPDDTLSLAAGEEEEIGVSEYFCLYPNDDVSPAKPAGILNSPNRATFKCLLPKRSRRKLPFSQPILTRNPKNPPERISPAPELLRWSYVVFDSITTDDDVVVFAKGLNPRQGLNRDPSEFTCVFYRNDDVSNGVKTTVTSSMQEVFRCKKPDDLSAISSASCGGDGSKKEEDQIKVTLSTHDQHVVPTLAYYSPNRKLAKENEKSLLCACTMVYNAAKFLKEWVTYHASIGIEKFIIYDNESNDNLEATIKDLNQQGFEIDTYFWLWPKSQESGFSHSAISAKSSCTWMAYIDVDEFIFSPSWLSSSSMSSSKSMLHSLVNSNRETSIGQINIGCYEFGPSNQVQHPEVGVTQGYVCRRKYENRHKSIVLLEAIDDSLLTMIHHFKLKPKYLSKRVGIKNLVVNHYKYQAWPEFKAKFRRRVSAYVVDWKDKVNPHSKDRTPGLGYLELEPPDWAEKFCEVHDYGLKELTGKWFGLRSPAGFRMSWQR